MSSFIDKMLGGWGGDNDNDINNPEIEKNHQDMRKKASYVSGVAVLIAWGIFLSSEDHQKKNRKRSCSSYKRYNTPGIKGFYYESGRYG